MEQWCKLGRPFSEFWRLSPAQIRYVLEANSEQKVRKGSVTDMMALAEAAKPRGGK